MPLLMLLQIFQIMFDRLIRENRIACAFSASSGVKRKMDDIK